jgi:Na+-driven multidrug efflux pump
MVRGFSAEPGILEAGTTYLRVIAWGYPFTAVSMLAGRILQGLGIGTPVLVLTIMRLLLIAVPLAWAMVYWWGVPVEGVWASMLLGSVVTGAAGAVWLRAGLARVERGALDASAHEVAVESGETVPVA